MPGRRRRASLQFSTLKTVEEEVLGKAYDSRSDAPPGGLHAAVPEAGRRSRCCSCWCSRCCRCSGRCCTKIAVDRYIAAEPGPRRRRCSTRYLPADAWTGLPRLGLLYLCVLLGSFVSEFAQMYLMQYTGQRAMFDLRRAADGAPAAAGPLAFTTAIPWAGW